MRHEIECGPGYAALDVVLGRGETVVAEAGAMAWMDESIEVETSTRGGLMAGLKRKLLAGETLFQNRFTGTQDESRITFAPGPAGDVGHQVLDGEELFLQKGAYLASSEGVNCDAKWDGLRGFFNEGLFVLHVSGSGDLFFATYGTLHEVEVDGSYRVDNGYAVAWEPSLEYRLTRARKVRSFLFSDQLVLEFSGRGKIWLQSRTPHGFANWIHPFRPVKSKSSSSND